MAGKSTFLKSVGIAIYLAHLGFPIPTSEAHISIFHGLVTTINLSDNLGLGHSHYFAEVKRVKEVAHLLAEDQPLLVIFDELFRGTNVKDAYDASKGVISAFARLPQSAFLVSTHIIEVADELRNYKTIQFQYFDMNWLGNEPQYNYCLKDGVSTERLGMHIIKQEGILKILEGLQ